MAGELNVATGADLAPTASARRFARACVTFAVWTALGLAGGLLAIVTLPGVFGYQALTVVSGSMEPTLEVGSVVIDEVIQPLDARPGDILTFQDPLSPRQLTHRLQKVRVEGDTVRMTTLGDANDAPERWSVPRDGQIGRVVAHMPKLGYVRAELSGNGVRLGLLAAFMLLGGLFLLDLWRPKRAER